MPTTWIMVSIAQMSFCKSSKPRANVSRWVGSVLNFRMVQPKVLSRVWFSHLRQWCSMPRWGSQLWQMSLCGLKHFSMLCTCTISCLLRRQESVLWKFGQEPRAIIVIYYMLIHGKVQHMYSVPDWEKEDMCPSRNQGLREDSLLGIAHYMPPMLGWSQISIHAMCLHNFLWYMMITLRLCTETKEVHLQPSLGVIVHI